MISSFRFITLIDVVDSSFCCVVEVTHCPPHSLRLLEALLHVFVN
nr:MAG TPA: hypothetical protein [Siphoviridae sp. ctgbm9]